MPSFTFTSPEGQSYTVDGPEGATEEQAWGVLQQQLGAAAKPAALPTAARKPEQVGFLEGAASSLAKGITSFGDIASGYGLAGKAITGNEADVKAKLAEIKREAQKIEDTPGLTFADMQRLYKERGIVDALAQLPKYATEQILQSAPQMAVPLAVGAGAGALSGPLAPIVGPVAGVAAYGAQQFGNFMQRQGQEVQKPEDVSVGRAAATAAVTAPLGYFVDRFTAGLGGLGEKGLVEVGKELAKRKAAGEIGAAGVAAGVAKQAGKGAATGFIAEAPTEVLESVAERYQAGLPLTDDKAKQEYLESFMGAGVAGGAIGGGSRGVAGTQAYKQAKAEQLAQAEAEKQAAEQAAAAPVTPAAPVEEPVAAAPVAEPVQDVNAPSQDREAMLKELEDQLAAIGEEAPLEQVQVKPVAETQQPVAPVAEETPVEAEKPKAAEPVIPGAKTEEQYMQDIRNGMSSINAVRDKRITQAQYEEYQALAETARKELDKLQSKQAATLSPAQQEAIKIAERMEALGEKDFTAGIRNAARKPSVESNLPFYREKLADLESKRGATEQVFSETHSLKDLMKIESDRGLEKLEQYQKTAAPKTRAVVERAGNVIQQVKDAINSAGYAVTDIGASSPYELQKLKNLHSQLEAGITQVLTQHNKLATGHKVSSQEALDKRIAATQADINKTSQELRRYAQATPEIREQEQAVTGAKRAAEKTARESGSLWSSLVGKLDQGEVRDIFSANPTFGQKRLQIKGGKKVTGAQVSDLVADGALDRFLPPDKRHDSPTFDEKESTDLIKQKVREQDYLPFDTKIEIEQIFGSVQEAERLVDEFLTIEEQNLELQTAADEQREGEIATRAVEPEGEVRPAEPVEREAREPEAGPTPDLELAAQTADELKAKQDEIDRLEKENTRLEKEAVAKEKADAEREEFVLTGSNRPADEAAARGQKDIFAAGEEPTLLDLDRNKQQDRQDKIREYAGVQRRRTTLERKVIAGEATIDLQRDLTRLKDTADDLKADIDATKEPRRSARNFFADATKAWDNGHISDEVYETIKLMFEKHPTLLEGLKLSVRQGPEGSSAAGEFKPYSRFINLYKDTRGVENPSTIRHEITHSLEQMMDAKSRQAVIDAWYADMSKAMRKFQDKAHQDYFKAVLDFFDKPTVENQRKAMDLLPGYDMYQYLNPSEYWAVNAEQLMGRHLSGAWGRFVNAVKRMFEGMKKLFGFDNKSAAHKAFASVMSGTHERLDKKVLANYVKDADVTLADIAKEGAPTNYKNYKGQDLPPAEWDNLQDSKLDTFQYKIVDKQIDTKRVIENIKRAVGEIADKFNAYIKEELYHGRTAKGVKDFLQKELMPLTKDMYDAKVTIDEFDEYLHNRHAPEYNEHVNKVNPNKPELQDRGSGISTEAAQEYMNNLSADRKATFEKLAKQLDSIVKKTQDILVANGIESKETIEAWRSQFPFYVPLKRDNLDYVNQGGGVGSGYATRGGVSKRATGSLKSVIDIFENIALQREQAIMKSEKARVGRALYGLAIQNPNPKFWLPINPDAIKNKDKLIAELEDLGLSAEDAANIAKEPASATFNKKTGLVEYAINPLLRNSDNVFPIRINGQDRFIIFNGSDPRAQRMVQSLKNLDADQMGMVMGTIGEVTRFMASMNTQYNPVFGAWNFLRDVQGAALNLTTTDIAGHEAEVLKGVWPALKSIYSDLRAQRAGKEPRGEWQELFERYQKAGGATGYKEQFSRGNDKPGIVAQELKKLDRNNVHKAAAAVFNWLSDYNDAMENAVRLSAFKVALDQGLSEDKAASLAKNLTVNFNRKGASSPTMQALYAFFNASVQGTKRLAETLKGPAGRKIMAGGFALGAIQAIALAMAGFDDDEPPEFLKDKNLILPTGDGNYLIVPMPMGFNIFPGIGRLMTEYVLGQAGLITGAKGLSDKSLNVASLVLDSFNPLGSGSLLQIVAPTAFDPLAAIESNKDAFGRPISKEDRATSPTPGFMRSREGASWFSKNLAEFLNYVSSPAGTKYTKGKISPTADQLDYLAGQYTGGVGREVLKTAKYAAAVAKGETAELPSYSVPIAGKVYGETTTPAAISAKFYMNVTELAQHENELKQRMKNKDDTREYRAEHPEVRFINRANYIENQITQLNKQKKLLQEKGAPEDRIKKIDEQKTKLMKGLNDQIKKLQQ